MREQHTFEPVFSKESSLLILGSFPSVMSRETGFYYGHPRNRFWRLIAEIFNTPLPCTVEEKKELILNNRLALWDVIASCQIKGSSDSSITDVIPNDLLTIIDNSCITDIVTNGGTAFRLYMKYQHNITGINPIKLPSTSPANASWSFERLIQEWSIIRKTI